ncbi:MAG: hypothetical protein JXQ73_19710 [Phycisphaerae bacterium]|nr:hypothetical protein [Phycisphaerae bacterium]
MTQDERPRLEECLSAYLDDELDESTRTWVEGELERSAEAREKLESLRKVVSVVGGLPRGEAPDDLSEVVLARLEREQLFNGIEPFPTAPSTPPGALSFGRLIGAAAVLLLAVLVGYLAVESVMDSRQPPIQVADAEGEKADRGPAVAKEKVEGDEALKGKAAPGLVAGAPEQEAPRMKGGLAKGGPAAAAREVGQAVEEMRVAMMPQAPAPAALAEPKAAPTVPPAAESGQAVAVANRSLDVRAKGALADDAREMKRPAQAKPIAKMKVAEGVASARDEERLAYRSGEKAGAVGDEIAGERKALGASLARKAPEAEQIASRRESRGRASETQAGGWRVRASRSPLESRLDTGITPRELDRLSVADEPVRLVLAARGIHEQTQVSWSLRAFCARNGIQEVGLLGRDSRIDPGTAFYVTRRGASGRTGGETFVLRGTASQMTKMLEELGRSVKDDVRVSLSAPSAQVTGWERTGQAILELREDNTGPATARGREELDQGALRKASTTGPALTIAKADGPARDSLEERVATTAPATVGKGGSPPRLAQSAEVAAPRMDEETARRRRMNWLGRPGDAKKATATSPGLAASAPAEGVGPVAQLDGSKLTSLGYVVASSRSSKAEPNQAPARRAGETKTRAAQPQSVRASDGHVDEKAAGVERDAPARLPPVSSRPTSSEAAVQSRPDRLLTVVITLETAERPTSQPIQTQPSRP